MFRGGGLAVLLAGLAAVAACRSRSVLQEVQVGREFHSTHLGLTIDFPDGWKVAPWDKVRPATNASGHIMTSTFYRGEMPLPIVSLSLEVGDVPFLDVPTGDELLNRAEKGWRVFGDQGQVSLTPVGPCVLVDSSVSRCLAHSVAPAARTLIDYDLYVDGRHVGALFLSKLEDADSLLTETQAIVTTIRSAP
jgi:hypothetical protein